MEGPCLHCRCDGLGGAVFPENDRSRKKADQAQSRCWSTGFRFMSEPSKRGSPEKEGHSSPIKVVGAVPTEPLGSLILGGAESHPFKVDQTFSITELKPLWCQKREGHTALTVWPSQRNPTIHPRGTRSPETTDYLQRLSNVTECDGGSCGLDRGLLRQGLKSLRGGGRDHCRHS